MVYNNCFVAYFLPNSLLSLLGIYHRELLCLHVDIATFFSCRSVEDLAVYGAGNRSHVGTGNKTPEEMQLQSHMESCGESIGGEVSVCILQWDR